MPGGGIAGHGMDGHLSVLFPANALRSTGARRVASHAKRLAPTRTLTIFLCDAAQGLRYAVP
jgi:6-phosphogluconolactonase/glucosamine-6-phosphate isomerase/deaminase